MEFDEAPHSATITRIESESTVFDASPFAGNVDLVFVDGGHDREILDADTLNAFRMVTAGGCVAWHDYGNPEYPDVAEYLDRIERPIFHVEETRLCLWFSDILIQSLLLDGSRDYSASHWTNKR